MLEFVDDDSNTSGKIPLAKLPIERVERRNLTGESTAYKIIPRAKDEITIS